MNKKLLIVGAVCAVAGAIAATAYGLHQKKIKDSTIIYMTTPAKAAFGSSAD